MAHGIVYIGTSGWSYKHWKGKFYPEQLGAKNYLNFYTQHYNSVELNNSFYKLPTEKAVRSWISEVPEGFKICPKMSRYLSHLKKLHDPEPSLERFFGVMDAMAEFIGIVLIQLPANVPFHAETAAHFYKVLYTRYKTYRFALEVRHNTWFTPESIALMKRYHITLVWAQSDKYACHEVLTAKDVYIRLHGPGALYDSAYSKKELTVLAKKIMALQQGGYHVWVFFNNDLKGYAIENSALLKSMLE
jgi:uncharacterized protein YecE (DUF72 family)